jgi:polygalacturonase
MQRKLLLFIMSLVYTFVHSQIFNVKDFGARGDGKTKDTNAIKQAIAKCASNNGGTVLFPVRAHCAHKLTS